jgi:putative transposase
VLELNGEVGHVPALMSLPPSLALSRFVNYVKTTTSRLVRRDFARDVRRGYRKPVFWSRLYGIISCAGAPLPVVKLYVEQQGALA